MERENHTDWQWAWRTLFPFEAPPRAQDLPALVDGKAKSAFRSRVRAVHPDQAVHRGMHPCDASAELRRVVAAFDRLRLEATAPVPYDQTTCSQATHAAQSPMRRDILPARPLALAQLLYHLDWIPSDAVFDCLRWQREQTVAVGDIAVRAGHLSAAEVRRVLLARVGQERFGECASRLGLLSPSDVSALLDQQRSSRPRVGAYLVASGLITASQLRDALRVQEEHNRSVRVREPARRAA